MAAPASRSKNMLIGLVGNGYPAFIAFFTGPILAQGLGVDGRGWVATATAPISLITTAATFGVPEAVSYVVARHRGLARAAGRRGLALLALAGLLAAVAVVLAAPFLSGGRPEVVQLIYIASIAVVPSLMVSVLRGVASAVGRWSLVTTERILSSTFRLLVLLPFSFTHSLTPLVATIAVAAIPVVGGTVYLRILRQGDVPVPEEVDEAKYRGILRYGSRVWIGSISGILLSRLDQTLLTPLAGTFELGLYVVAVSISELPLIINSAVRDVTFVTDAAKRDDERLAASARISTLLCLVAGAFIGTSMIWWLPLLFGHSFGHTIPVAAILLVAVVLGTPGSIAGSALSARGFPALRSWSLAIACGLNIIGLIVLAPPMGAVGAALATLLGNLVSSNLNLVFLRRKFGLPIWSFYGIHRVDFATMTRFGRRMLRRGRA